MLAILAALAVSGYYLLITRPVQNLIGQRVLIALSEKTCTSITASDVSFKRFEDLLIKDLYVEDQNNDTLLYAESVVVHLDSLNRETRYVGIESIELYAPTINISKNSDSLLNFSFILDSLINKDKVDSLKWNVNIKGVDVEEGCLSLKMSPDADYLFDDLKVEINQHDGIYDFQRLNFNMSNGLQLKNTTAQVQVNDSGISIPYLSLNTANSAINLRNVEALSQTGQLKGAPLDSITFGMQSKMSYISGKDVFLFTKQDFNIANDLVFDGQVSGDMSHIKGNELHFFMDDILDVVLSFDAKDILDTKNRDFKVDLSRIKIDVVNSAKLYNQLCSGSVLDISNYMHWDEVNFVGQVCGYKDVITCDGDIFTPFGKLDVDMFAQMNEEFKDVEYKGDINTQSFKIGQALNNPQFDVITADIDIDGQYKDDFFRNNQLTGLLSDFSFMDYEYSNIFLEGKLDKRLFTGIFNINDPNATVRFDGTVDLNGDNPSTNFSLDVSKVDLVKLNLNDDYDRLALDFKINSYLTGSSIDNLTGNFSLDSFSVVTENGQFFSDSLDIMFKPEGDVPLICLISQYVNAEVKGRYNFKELPGFVNMSLAKHMDKLPQVFAKPKGEVPNDFVFDIQIDDLKDIMKVFDIPIRSNGYTTLSGSVNSLEDTYKLIADVPYVMTGKYMLDSISVDLENDTSKYYSALVIEHVTLNGAYQTDHFNLNSTIANDTMLLTANWNNDGDDTYIGDFSSKINLETYGDDVKYVANMQPSSFVLSDTLWQLNEHKISFLAGEIVVDNLLFYKTDSYFALDGTVSKDLEDKLHLNVDNFDLSSLDRFLSVKKFNFAGILTGFAEVSGLLGNPIFESDLGIQGFDLNKTYLGNLSVKSQWNALNQEVDIDMRCQDTERDVESLAIYGTYQPQKDSLALIATFDNLNLTLLQPYLEPTLAKLYLNTSGTIDVIGSLKSPELYGGLMVDNSGFSIDYLNTSFALEDTIYFDKHKFQLMKAKVFDQEGNIAYVTGDITHTGYKKFMVDLVIDSDRLLGLNTTAADNEYFYGSVYVGGAITIKNTETETLIGSNVKTLKGTDLKVPLSPVSTATTNDFITYVSAKDNEPLANGSKKPVIVEPEVNQARELIINMNYDLTPESQITLEFDVQSGDMIEASGTGKLNIQFQKGQPFQMFGDYEILTGRYIFTMQQIVNKAFTIDAGSRLNWSGRPGSAMVDITATYGTRASLYNLMPDAISESNKNRRVPVDIKLMLNKRLSQPDIRFDIELPNTDEDTQQSVSSVINSDEEMSRQVLSLLIMNSFYTPDYHNTGTSSSTNSQISNVAAVTVSEFLSNQLSGWMSQLNDNLDLGFRYMPGEELSDEGLTPEEYEMAISSQLLNNRLSVNGTFGYQNYDDNTRPPNLNSNFVGEVDVELKLTENLNLKAYSHQNDDILYENSNMKQGAGLAYVEEFSTFKELVQRYKARLKRFFTRKKKKHTDAILKEEEDDLEVVNPNDE